MTDVGPSAQALMALSCVLAGMGGGLVCAAAARLAWRNRIRRSVLGEEGANPVGSFAVGGIWAKVLGRMEDLTRREAALPGGPFGRGAGDGSFQDLAMKAGLDRLVSQGAFRRASWECAGALGAAGAVVGSLFSGELMAMLALAGLGGGFALPRVAMNKQVEQRRIQLERELPEFLEVVALGLRSGLSFDRSFSLYPQYFRTPFSAACADAQSSWQLGLRSREEALRQLAATYGSSQFSRVVESAVRALRFGSSLEWELGQLASEARLERKAFREEQAAKAPVKMMVPIGTLILPAMLLLVTGPILLGMMKGF